MKIEEYRLTIDSGRIHHPVFGVIGLGPDGEVGLGYDNLLALAPADEDYAPDADEDFPSKRELVELADAMIARWTAFRQRMSEDQQ